MNSQLGATLIIVLISILVILGLTGLGLEMSLLEFKSIHRRQASITDFYDAENCLQQTVQKITDIKDLPHYANCRDTSCVNDYSLLDFSQLAPSWWKTNGYVCGKNNWLYVQLLVEQVREQSSFYRITVYHEPHLLLQCTLAKQLMTQHTTIIAWRQIALS